MTLQDDVSTYGAHTSHNMIEKFPQDIFMEICGFVLNHIQSYLVPCVICGTQVGTALHKGGFYFQLLLSVLWEFSSALSFLQGEPSQQVSSFPSILYSTNQIFTESNIKIASDFLKEQIPQLYKQ